MYHIVAMHHDGCLAMGGYTVTGTVEAGEVIIWESFKYLELDHKTCK